MKPLVYYCRWHQASLRLQGRDETAVWGQLIFTEHNKETAQKFHFNLHTWLLTLHEPDGERVLQLDEKGVVVNE